MNSSKLQHLGCNGGWQCIQLKLRQASLFADLTGMGCSSFAPLVLAVDFGVQAEDLACKQNHRTGEGKQARRHAWIETKPNQDRYQHLRAQPDGTSVLGGLNLGPFGSFPNEALPGAISGIRCADRFGSRLRWTTQTRGHFKLVQVSLIPFLLPLNSALQIDLAGSPQK